LAGFRAELVTFIDIDEDGNLEYLIQQKSPTTNTPFLKVIYNNVRSENFFVKALLVNQRETKTSTAYGDNGIGISYRFSFTDPQDTRGVFVGT